MKKYSFIIIIFISALLLFGADKGETRIALQPFTGFDAKLSGIMKDSISAAFTQFGDVEVILLSPIPLPKSAYYKPRRRYRAEKLLDFLDSIDTGEYTKVIGLTHRDISTTTAIYTTGAYSGVARWAAIPASFHRSG